MAAATFTALAALGDHIARSDEEMRVRAAAVLTR